VTPEQPKKIVKQDILSLFSAPVASVPSASLGYGQFGAAPQQSIWAADIGSAQQRLVPLTSMGGWGAAPGLNGAMVAPPHMNMWENLPTQQSMQQPPAHPHPETTNLWGSSTPTGLSSGDLFGNSLTQAPQKKDDVFGDLWGGFK
jgi:stromal membrane-associated protein